MRKVYEFLNSFFDIISENPCALFFITDFIVSTNDIIPNYSHKKLFDFFESRKDYSCAILAQQLYNVGEITEEFVLSSDCL